MLTNYDTFSARLFCGIFGIFSLVVVSITAFLCHPVYLDVILTRCHVVVTVEWNTMCRMCEVHLRGRMDQFLCVYCDVISLCVHVCCDVISMCVCCNVQGLLSRRALIRWCHRRSALLLSTGQSATFDIVSVTFDLLLLETHQLVHSKLPPWYFSTTEMLLYFGPNTPFSLQRCFSDVSVNYFQSPWIIWTTQHLWFICT